VTARAPARPIIAGLGRDPVGAALAAGVVAVASVAAMAMGPVAVAIPPAVAAALFLVRQPLALLTLYTYVGLFKEQPVVEAVPGDVTVLLGVLLCAVCAGRWLSGRVRGVPLGLAAPIAVIGVMLVVSLGWTPSPDYGGEKALHFFTLTLLAALAPFFLVKDGRDLRRFFSWTLAIALITAVVTIANPPEGTGRLTIGDEGNTIGASRLLCTAAIILLVGALTDLYRTRGWAIVGALALIVVAAAIGSRGPILSFGLALAATGAIYLARVPRKLAPVALAVVAGAALIPFVSLPAGSAERLTHAARDPVGALEADPRYTAFGQAVDLIEKRPLIGVGAGGFQNVGMLTRPPEDYPHNMLLEVWAELGLVPLVVLAVSIGAVISRLARRAWALPRGPASSLVYILAGVFLFNLFAALLSGDLNDNRTYWGSFGLAWLIVRYGVPRTSESGRA
jgi:O-antigen ligase